MSECSALAYARADRPDQRSQAWQAHLRWFARPETAGLADVSWLAPADDGIQSAKAGWIGWDPSLRLGSEPKSYGFGSVGSQTFGLGPGIQILTDLGRLGAKSFGFGSVGSRSCGSVPGLAAFGCSWGPELTGWTGWNLTWQTRPGLRPRLRSRTDLDLGPKARPGSEV